jgi:hypothetical protein
MLPRRAVKSIISSEDTLTAANAPLFIQTHLEALEKLRHKNQGFGINITSEQKKTLKVSCYAIADRIQRERACIASLEGAQQCFEKNIECMSYFKYGLYE